MVLYLFLGYTNVKNLRLCMALLKLFIYDTLRANPNDMMLPSLRLKLRMLR